MKKMIAMLMLLCVTLLPFAGVAEDGVVNWEDVAPVLEASGVTGDFYALNELGLAIWLPDGLGQVELSDDAIAAGYLYMLTDENQTNMITVSAVNAPGLTLDQALENAKANGMYDPEIVVINGLSAITYLDKANNMGAVVLIDTNYNVITFSFMPISTDEEIQAYVMISASIMPL